MVLLKPCSEKRKGIIHPQVVTNVIYRTKWYSKLLLGADTGIARINILSFYLCLVSLLLLLDNHQVDCGATKLCHSDDNADIICTDISNITNISISNLNKLCNNTFNNTQLMLQDNLINKMHFDFCHEIHPIFALPCSVFDVSFKLTNSELKNVSSTIDCKLITDLMLKDKAAEKNHLEMTKILNRADICSTDEEEASECEKCEGSYKNWLCSGAFDFCINNKTLDICTSVTTELCYDCPALAPNNSYGGYSAYTCGEVDTSNTENHKCPDRCASIPCLDQLYPPYNSTTQ